MKKAKLITIVAIIAVIFIAALLCLLLIGYVPPAPKATEAKIPEGWEAVSTQDNVTFIQMKEGEDEEIWFDRNAEEYHIHIALPQNEDYVAQTYGDEQYIEAIVYYGYGWRVHDTEQNTHYLVARPNPDGARALRLTMDVENGSSHVLWEDKEFANTLSASYREKDDQIGYTKAAIVRIPISVFAGSTDTPVYFSFRNAKGTSLGANTLYFTHDADSHQVIAETFPTAREKHIQHSFPRVILTFIEELNSPDGFFTLITYLTAIATPIVAIPTAIKRRKRHYPYLILAIYAVLLLICMFGFGDSWASVALFLMLVYYVIPGVAIVALLQWIIEGGLRIRDKKTHRNQSATVDSPSPLPAVDPIGAELDSAENLSSDDPTA